MKIYTEKIFDVLELIRRRNNYLSSKSIIALQDFINGYMTLGKWGIYDESLIYDENDVDFNEFLFWIQKIPFISATPGPYFAEFLLKKTDDEYKAFDLFYELLDDFKKLKGVVG